MTREQLEHLIRAAAVIAADDAIVVIGSQAIHPEQAELIDGSEAARHRLADPDTLLRRLSTVDASAAVQDAARRAIERAFRKAGRP
jgi:hypothetical protein